MILILEGASEALISQLSSEFSKKHDSQIVAVTDGAPEDLTDLENVKDSLQIFLKYPEPTGNLAQDRYTDLLLASHGIRYWGPNLSEEYPTYAGDLLEDDVDEFQVSRILVDGDYSQNITEWRKKEYKGVQYTGRTFASPKTYLLVDAKRKFDPHNPAENPEAERLLASLTDDFWGLTALVSASSSKALEIFVADHDQSIPITTSTATAAKMKFAGYDCIESSIPSETSQEFGIKLRSSVTLFERQ